MYSSNASVSFLMILDLKNALGLYANFFFHTRSTAIFFIPTQCPSNVFSRLNISSTLVFPARTNITVLKYSSSHTSSCCLPISLHAVNNFLRTNIRAWHYRLREGSVFVSCSQTVHPTA